ncbi:hypothetical protein KAU37_05035 [Candidatus Bipolaricaulota bacterium]|nr:hypothetical protein [Candidatus Bipolaricaulota bacterium]
MEGQQLAAVIIAWITILLVPRPFGHRGWRHLLISLGTLVLVALVAGPALLGLARVNYGTYALVCAVIYAVATVFISYVVRAVLLKRAKSHTPPDHPTNPTN